MVNTADFLRIKGLKPSLQRMQIYEFIKDRKDHPTVEMIYSELSPAIPTLSKTTVYNTLKTFVNHGLAQPIIIDENEIRFDPDTSTHGHFKCERCGNIFDFRVDLSKFEVPELNSFKIFEEHVYFKGICQECQN